MYIGCYNVFKLKFEPILNIQGFKDWVGKSYGDEDNEEDTEKDISVPFFYIVESVIQTVSRH